MELVGGGGILVQDTTLTKWSTVQRTVHGPSTVQKPSRPVQVRSRYDPGTVQIRSNSTIHGPATIQTVRSTVWTVQTVEPLDRSWTAYLRSRLDHLKRTEIKNGMVPYHIRRVFLNSDNLKRKKHVRVFLCRGLYQTYQKLKIHC
jgi:hypothetical protein